MLRTVKTTLNQIKLTSIFSIFYFFLFCFQRGSDELLSQAAVMAPAADNNNQDLATKKAKLDSNTVIGGVGECKYPNHYFINPCFNLYSVLSTIFLA